LQIQPYLFLHFLFFLQILHILFVCLFFCLIIQKLCNKVIAMKSFLKLEIKTSFVEGESNDFFLILFATF